LIAMRQLRLVGARGRERARDAVHATCVAWAQDWCVGFAAAALQGPEPASLGDGGPLWASSGTDDAMAFVGMAEATEAARWTQPQSRDPAQRIARDAGDAALADLARRLAALDAAAPVARDRTPPADWSAPLAGALAFRVGWKERALTLVLGPARVAALAGVGVPRTTRLAPRGESVQSAVLALRVELDLGALPLASVRALAPGALLRTDVPLSAAFALRDPIGPLTLRCRLGRREQRRAALLTD
jgi:hypothetical protein